MNLKIPVMVLLAGGLMIAPAMPSATTTAQAQTIAKKDGFSGDRRRPAAKSAPRKAAPRAPAARKQAPRSKAKSSVKRPPQKRPPAAKRPPQKRPPAAARPRRPGTPAVRHRRPWRPGLKWRWIAVPSIIIAGELDWCHYHRYPVRGMRYHRNVECHRHASWNHPSIRYVEGY